MYVIPTTKAEHIAKLLRDKDCDVIYTLKNKDNKSVFPDGELYTRIDRAAKLGGRRVVVIHSGQPDPNGGLLELYNILEILNDPVQSTHVKDKEYDYKRLKKPSSIEVFFLYFPYGMQDKIFETGECNMAESIVKKLVSYYHVSKIYAVDPHFEGALWAKNYPISVVKAVGAIGDALAADGITDAVRVAPDLGSQERLDIGGFSKKRLNSYDVELRDDGDLSDKVKGKTVVVWDDLIETGGTMARAGKSVEDMGAKRVVAVATHGVLDAGVKKIRDSFSKLYLSNTIDVAHANVDVSGIVFRAICD